MECANCYHLSFYLLFYTEIKICYYSCAVTTALYMRKLQMQNRATISTSYLPNISILVVKRGAGLSPALQPPMV